MYESGGSADLLASAASVPVSGETGATAPRAGHGWLWWVIGAVALVGVASVALTWVLSSGDLHDTEVAGALVLTVWGMTLWASKRPDPESRANLGAGILAGTIVAFAVLFLQQQADDIASNQQDLHQKENLGLTGVRRALNGGNERSGLAGVLREAERTNLAMVFGARGSLAGIDLRGDDVRGAFLRGRDLTGALLRNARLNGSDLVGAGLNGAYLGGTDLRAAKLQGASLRCATMGITMVVTGVEKTSRMPTYGNRRTDFRHADLRGADLRGAWLAGAVFRTADLTGAKLDGAIATPKTIWPRGFHARAHGVRTVPAGSAPAACVPSA